MNEIIDINPSLVPNLSTTSTNGSGTIKLNNLPPLDNTADTTKKSVNFGPGIEMLMNDKKKSMSPKSDIKLSDLELLGSTINLAEGSGASKGNARQTMFNTIPGAAGANNGPGGSGGSGGPGGPRAPNISLNISEPNNINNPNNIHNPNNPNNPNIGEATARGEAGDKTWDGFNKFNEIPVDPAKSVPVKPPMSNETILKEKLRVLRRLEALEKKGIQLTKRYTMESNLAEMQGEYEMIKSEKEKGNSVKFQGKMLMAFVSAIEFLNAKFDPFDIKLDGWGESVNENLDEYDDIFGELHEKYGGKTKVAPELKLLFMLGGSAAMLHMTNTMFKSSMPGMDDIMRQNPELMQQFTQAAVSSMSQQNPGFGGFMSGVMGGGGANGAGMANGANRAGGPGRRPPMQMPPHGSPPGPPAEMRRNPPSMQSGAHNFNRRPDVGMARGVAHFDDAINMEEKFENINPKKSTRTPRPEMRGPGDINDILSGLKTKRVNIQKPDNSSTISVEDLKDIKNTNFDMPRKSKRKPRSERNTVSLNL